MDSGINVIAGMVLYNSNYERMIKCIVSLNNQVDKIILFDNSPNEMGKIQQKEICEKYKCQYIFSGKNLGMPEAMNRIILMAEQEGYEWVLTMNADSIVPKDLIEQYSKYFSQSNIGMICPQIIDHRRKYMLPDLNKENQYVDMCITSAACTRVVAWRQVGGFDGWLFVDLLDNDISKRMILNGWNILKLNSLILDQEYGDIYPKPLIIERFWVKVGKIMHNDNYAKFSYKKIVHPNRVFYTCRNIIYLNKKYKNYNGIGYRENYNCSTFLGFIICFIFPSILRAENKYEVIKAVFKGFKVGKEKQVEPWIATPIK